MWFKEKSRIYFERRIDLKFCLAFIVCLIHELNREFVRITTHAAGRLNERDKKLVRQIPKN